MLVHKEIHQSCLGCLKIISSEGGQFCSAYRNPSMWWEKYNACPLATHKSTTLP